MTATALRARPTMYNGIQMRSRLEARVAALFDAMGLDWKYEPRAYKSARGEYLPDFQVGDHTFVEVKSAEADWLVPLAKSFRILREAHDGAVLWLILSDGQCAKFDADPALTGYITVCRECRRHTIGNWEPERPCACGSVQSPAAEWLEWPPK